MIAPRQRKLAFATILVAFVMDIIDSTIVNTGIPAIQRDLGASSIQIQWVVAGYFLSFALLLITGGRMGDLYGYRRLFLIGMAGFTGASALCGLASTPQFLIGARLIQGSAAALMGPQIMAFVQIMYQPTERLSALAFFGVLGGLSAVLGPILSGFLIESHAWGLGWRLIFLINLPVGIAGLIAGWIFLPLAKSPHPLKLDPIGAILLGIAMFALLFPLIEGREYHWAPWCYALLLAGMALLFSFWRYAKRRIHLVGSALIAPELFYERCFGIGLLASLTFSLATGGFLFILPQMLQLGLGYSPLQSALIHIPFAIGVTGGISLIGRKAMPKLGKFVLMAGAIIFAIGLWGVTVTIGVSMPLAPIFFFLLIAGLGMGTIAGPLGPVTLARVDTGHAGTAGGTHNAVQQVGGAAGTALIGTLFFLKSAPPQNGASIVSAFGFAAYAIILALGCVFLFAVALPLNIFGKELQRLEEPNS